MNAGTSAFYLSVTNGDLLQRVGTTPVYDGLGIWGSTGRLSHWLGADHVVVPACRRLQNEGISPAYFYAIDSGGSLLPLGGGLRSTPTASGAVMPELSIAAIRRSIRGSPQITAHMASCRPAWHPGHQQRLRSRPAGSGGLSG